MILVLNCGSQSIKWKLFGENLEPVKNSKAEILPEQNYKKALEEELEKLKKENISLIGHRVVHGGNLFSKPARITDANIGDLEKLNHLAPLHNPFNVLGIKACQDIFRGSANIAVFDTEFFKNLPEIAQTYALPEEIVKEFGFKRFGFHGISHEFVVKEAEKKLKKFKNLKIITCHLGGGASICAIKNGKPIDTSMGFTPMQGLVMMTRIGDMDSGIVLQLVKEFGEGKAENILNKESGIKGICGEGDMLKVLEMAKRGEKKARLALEVFVYSIQKYIGAYSAILGGCDVLIFTGAIGSGSAKIRNMICRNLGFCLAKTKILAVETDEELAIAQKII